MKRGRLLPMWLNPLKFFEIEESTTSRSADEVTIEALLRFACEPEIDPSIRCMAKRYISISKQESTLFAPPSEPKLLAKLVWPLRNAKTCFILGNYLGTISLCGMVAEMVAMLVFDISEFRAANCLTDEDSQRSRFCGRTFEEASQSQRVRILYEEGVIESSFKQTFEIIREKRNRYLHLWSQHHKQLENDAKQCYKAAVALVAHVIGQEIRDGMIVLNPRLMDYLERTGFPTQDVSADLPADATG